MNKHRQLQNFWNFYKRRADGTSVGQLLRKVVFLKINWIVFEFQYGYILGFIGASFIKVDLCTEEIVNT